MQLWLRLINRLIGVDKQGGHLEVLTKERHTGRRTCNLVLFDASELKAAALSFYASLTRLQRNPFKTRQTRCADDALGIYEISVP